jgi:hypothetical protein
VGFLRQHRQDRPSQVNYQAVASILRSCFVGGGVADSIDDADESPRIRIILLPLRPSR